MKKILPATAIFILLALFSASTISIAQARDKLLGYSTAPAISINQITVNGSDSTNTKNNRMKNLNLIRIQNERYVIKMLHNKKAFPFGKRRVVAYAGMNYNKKGEPMINEMISRLKDMGVNCYSYLIEGHSIKELGALPQFCKQAAKSGIEVWVVLVPPTEEPKLRKGTPGNIRYPPYGLDYIKWAKNIAEISKSHPNLTLLMIDDFAYNMKYFTPNYLKKVYDALRKENPNFLLGLTIYEDQLYNKKFNFKPYKPFINAVEWGYQHNAKKFPHYGVSAGSLTYNIRDFRKTFPNTVLIPCIYFLAHSSWSRKATIPYLKDAMKIAYKQAGVALVYRTPELDTPHFNLVRKFCTEHHVLNK